MRLQSLKVTNAAPIRLFNVDDLSDIVVVAGPNGVGKTRLLQHIINSLRGAAPTAGFDATIEATSPRERTAWGGKSVLHLSDQQDLQSFLAILQTSRHRRNWSSSLLQFESDRTIQNLQPLAFSWDMADPADETVGWETTFGFLRDRFQDTVHSMFRMIEAQRRGIATRAVDLRKHGHDSMRLDFQDPMESFKEIFSSLLGPKELVDPQLRDQRLLYTYEGQVLEWTTLSSGEREVVTIAFDFLLRRPEDCVVFFDEPELHLHPELSYRLLQTLQRIGSRNQFFFSTHSPDIITASLDRTVIFVAPPSATAEDQPANQAITVRESDTTNEALKLLGQSIGIIALGRRIVLIEGEQSSLDKQTYGSIIQARWPGLVLVPSGGKHAIEAFSTVYEAVLSKSLWGVRFFMLCDLDTAPPDTLASQKARAEGRLSVLSRYHLENYFLDEQVWADALAPMEPEASWLRSAAEIRQVLRDCARSLVSYAAALMISANVRQLVGNVNILPKGCHGKTLDELTQLISATVASESERVRTALDMAAISQETRAHFERLAASIDNDTEEWQTLIPGKSLLAVFASEANLSVPRAKALYLHTALQSPSSPFAEVIELFGRFAAAK